MIGTSRSVWGFDPRSVPGCQLWLDGADASTTTSITSSGIWVDKSGNSSNTSYVAGASGFSVGTINSLPAVTFPGGTNNLLTANVSTSTATGFSIFFIASRSSSFPSGARYMANESSSLQIYAISTTTISSYVGAVFSTNSLTTSTDVPFIFSLVVSSSTFNQWGNGVVNSSSGTTGSASGTKLIIGSSGTNYDSIFVFAGKMGEILVFNTALTTSQRQQIEGYLAHKWGLTGYYDSSIPLSIPGCALWLDGSDQSSMTLSGSSVTQWTDKSGNGNNFVRQGSFAAPVISNNAVGSLSAVSFTGNSTQNDTVNQILTNASFPLNSSAAGYSIFVVSRQNASAPSYTGYNYLLTAYGGTTGSGLLYGTKEISKFLITANGTEGPFYGFNDLTANVPNTLMTTLNQTSIVVSGSVLTPYLNGAAMTAKTGTCVALTGISVGNAYAPGGGNFTGQTWGGIICEVLIFNSAVTTTQRQTIEGYLSKKWGIGSSTIPSTHPFSSIRPHLRTFQPIDVPGCQLWLDAADQSSLTLSGSNVTQWNDKSGIGNNAVANTGTVTTNSTRINGLNTIRFSANSFLNIASFAMAANVSMFAVLRGVGAQGIGNFGYFFIGNGIEPSFFIYTLQPSFGNISGHYSSLVASTGETAWYMPSTDFFLNNPGLMYIDNNVSFVNGSQLTRNPNRASVPNAVSATTYTNIRIGGRINGDSLAFDFAELLFYNNTLTTSQRQQVEGYLAHKWGLSPSLPVISPLSIPGCQLWLDGADPAGTGVQPSNGATVSTWVDKSGNAKNATATGTPTYLTGGGINFNGSSYFLNQTFSMNLSQRSVFIVFQETSRTQYAGIFILIPTLPERFDQSQTTGLSYSTTDNSFQAYGNNSYGLYIGNANPLPKAIYNENMNITAGSGYLNGTNTTNVTATYTAGTCSGYGLACRWQDGSVFGSLRLNGVIHEVIVFNTPLNTTQRQQIEGYLARKWGISISATLPSPHPFKSFPPATLPFSPRNISGLALWLDGADSSTITGTTSVTAWRDKSANGYVANSFVNSVPNPSWVPNVRNGNGVIQYSAGNGSSIANFVLAQTMSIFKVYYPINQGTSSPFIEQGPNAGSESGFFFHSQNDNNFFIKAGSVGIANFGTTTVSNTWQMIEGINPDPANGNTMAFYVNGITKASGGTQSDTTTVTKTLYINGRAGTSSVSYNNYLAELIIYNIALTTSQRQQVEGYLAQKWGLTTSLPATHPYKKLPA